MAKNCAFDSSGEGHVAKNRGVIDMLHPDLSRSFIAILMYTFAARSQDVAQAYVGQDLRKLHVLSQILGGPI